MADSPEKSEQAASPTQTTQPASSTDSYFPIELTELDLDKVVGGVASHSLSAGGTGHTAEGTIMCCW